MKKKLDHKPSLCYFRTSKTVDRLLGPRINDDKGEKKCESSVGSGLKSAPAPLACWPFLLAARWPDRTAHWLVVQCTRGRDNTV